MIFSNEKAKIAIAEQEYFDDEGKSCGRCWTIDANSENGSCGFLTLDNASDLFLLRKAIDAYIEAHELKDDE